MDKIEVKVRGCDNTLTPRMKGQLESLGFHVVDPDKTVKEPSKDLKQSKEE